MQKRNAIDLVKIQECIDTLGYLLENTNELYDLEENQRLALIIAAGKISRPNREELQQRRKDLKKIAKRKEQERDKHARKNTGIRSARENLVFSAPLMLEKGVINQKESQKISSPRNCYVCKTSFGALHHFYDAMCKACGDFNYAKRFQTAHVKGQVILVTGSRLKIGYHISLMLLRGGATVIATTRFPHDAAVRFAKEQDFEQWGHRLKIHGLDLRHIPSVEIFCSYIEQQYSRLDVIINNAAQTVRRPPGFYAHLMDNETLPLSELPKHAQLLLEQHRLCLKELNAFSQTSEDNKNLPISWQSRQLGLGISASAKLSQIPYSIDYALKENEVFPMGKLDADLQQVDLRKTNSWRLKLGEINTSEMLEVQLVNAVAPFVLNNRLLAVMQRENTGQKHIINVSAMEGKFQRFHKEDRHPHTNMAKAALNMMTHTSAGSLAKEGIYMNAVDTGWVTDEDPIELAKRKENLHDFQPPLDIVDGAARVLDPLYDGINTGKHWCGKFLKDYNPIDW